MRAPWLALIAVGCHGAASRAEPPRIAVVRGGDLVDRVLLTGSLHAASAVDLGLPIQSQTAIRWLIADGTLVKAGDRVLELDNTDQVSSLADDRAQLRTSEAELQRSTAATAKAVADKQREIRGAEIVRDKAKMQADLPADLMSVRKAQENQLALDQANASLAESRRGLATLIATTALDQRVVQISLDQTHREIAETTAAIDSLVVRAPRDGVVVVERDPWLGRAYKVGDKVSPNQPVVSLPDLGKPIEVRADLIDVDDGRIALNMVGACTLDAYPDDPIPCTVDEITPVASPQEGQDSLRRTFGVTLALAHRDPARLRPGMSVKVELHRQPLHALVVPRGALIRGDGDRVRLASGALRTVAVGPCDAQQCAIEQGLSAGELVALGGDR